MGNFVDSDQPPFLVWAYTVAQFCLTKLRFNTVVPNKVITKSIILDILTFAILLNTDNVYFSVKLRKNIF